MAGRYEVALLGIEDDQLRFHTICLDCGGYEMNLRGAAGDMVMVHCAACGVWFARLAALKVDAISEARRAGYDISLPASLQDDLPPYQPPDWFTPDDA